MAPSPRYIIIGANDLGVELVRRISETGHATFMGFFDFRRLERLPPSARAQFVGSCSEVSAFVRRRAVQTIYITAPMDDASRIEELPQQFRATRASIYFALDSIALDLLHPRRLDIAGYAYHAFLRRSAARRARVGSGLLRHRTLPEAHSIE
jgi:FlaA1/EpsC-like NDP-sugar epimerase